MNVDVVMPKLGESIMEGTIIKWMKSVGESIKSDETLLEISTDKVDSEIPSPVSGKIVELLGKENETLPVGAVIARIESSEEKTQSFSKKPLEETIPPALLETMSTRAMKKPFFLKEEKKHQGRFFSPLVMKIAEAENISMSILETLSGTGKGGRVTKRDILKYLSDPKPQSSTTKSTLESFENLKISHLSASSSSSGIRSREELIPITPIRKKIAHHMRHSLDTSAHVYSVSECDMSRVRKIIDANKEDFFQKEGFKLTFNPFILHAVVRSLGEFPLLNSTFDGNQIVQKNYINLGMAVATDRGLFVPVVKDAENKNFRGIARNSYDLAIRTRNGKLKVEDIEGSTFSVTNPGVFGNIFGLPIINQPNVGILGVGAIKKRAIVLESDLGDTIAIRSMTYLSLSFDHRLVDGDIGGKFLQRVVYYLENFPEKI